MNLFAEHTKYDVEQLKRNHNFLLRLIDDLEKFYFTYKKKESVREDRTEIEMSANPNHIQNVFFSVNKTNGISIVFNDVKFKDEKKKEIFLKKYPDSYKSDYGVKLKMKDITEDKVSSFMSDIVYAVESLGYSPRR